MWRDIDLNSNGIVDMNELDVFVRWDIKLPTSSTRSFNFLRGCILRVSEI